MGFILNYLFFCGIAYALLCIMQEPIRYAKDFAILCGIPFVLTYITVSILGIDLFVYLYTLGLWIFGNIITTLPFIFLGYILFDWIRSKFKSINVHS